MSREVIFTLLALFPRMDLQNFTLTKNSVLMRTKKRQIYHTEKYSWSLHKVLSQSDFWCFPINFQLLTAFKEEQQKIMEVLVKIELILSFGDSDDFENVHCKLRCPYRLNKTNQPFDSIWSEAEPRIKASPARDLNASVLYRDIEMPLKWKIFIAQIFWH